MVPRIITERERERERERESVCVCNFIWLPEIFLVEFDGESFVFRFLAYGLVDKFYCVWSCSRVLYRVVLFKKIINI